MGLTATSSQEHIYAAADALILAGKTPTLLAVREALGGGSMSILSRSLSEWRQSREDKETAETSSPNLPSAMKVLLESMGRAFCSEAVSLAGRDLQSIREQADKTAGEARQRLSDLEEALMVLEQERDRLEETISSLQEEASRLKDEAGRFPCHPCPGDSLERRKTAADGAGGCESSGDPEGPHDSGAGSGTEQGKLCP